MLDYEAARRDLEILYQAASALEGWHKDQAEEFIRVGEYGLALDGIAHAYLSNRVSIPSQLFRLFDSLATRMKLDQDPEYDGVAKLRKAQGTEA